MIILGIFIITFQFTLSKAFRRSTDAAYAFLFTLKLFYTMFRKHKIASRVPLFFRMPNWSSARFSKIVFCIRPRMIFVKILDVCVKMLKVRCSSHFIDLLFFGSIIIILFFGNQQEFFLFEQYYVLAWVSILTVGVSDIHRACMIPIICDLSYHSNKRLAVLVWRLC